jgi:hypothetical protein
VNLQMNNEYGFTIMIFTLYNEWIDQIVNKLEFVWKINELNFNKLSSSVISSNSAQFVVEIKLNKQNFNIQYSTRLHQLLNRYIWVVLVILTLKIYGGGFLFHFFWGGETGNVTKKTPYTPTLSHGDQTHMVWVPPHVRGWVWKKFFFFFLFAYKNNKRA